MCLFIRKSFSQGPRGSGSPYKNGTSPTPHKFSPTTVSLSLSRRRPTKSFPRKITTLTRDQRFQKSYSVGHPTHGRHVPLLACDPIFQNDGGSFCDRSGAPIFCPQSAGRPKNTGLISDLSLNGVSIIPAQQLLDVVPRYLYSSVQNCSREQIRCSIVPKARYLGTKLQRDAYVRCLPLRHPTTSTRIVCELLEHPKKGQGL
jgi:hypothetical protein